MKTVRAVWLVVVRRVPLQTNVIQMWRFPTGSSPSEAKIGESKPPYGRERHVGMKLAVVGELVHFLGGGTPSREGLTPSRDEVAEGHVPHQTIFLCELLVGVRRNLGGFVQTVQPRRVAGQVTPLLPVLAGKDHRVGVQKDYPHRFHRRTDAGSDQTFCTSHHVLGPGFRFGRMEPSGTNCLQ